MKKQFTNKARYLGLKLTAIIFALLLFASGQSWGQIYFHNFGTTSITTKPFTGTPNTFDINLSTSSWTTSASAFGGLAGNGGGTSASLSLSNSSGTPTFTLTFNVASGFQLSITSFNFWRVRSSTGAQNWALTINGTSVGSGTIPTSGALLGETNVSNTISGLTGTITVVFSMSGASGSGTCRLDDFTLNGSVTSTGGSAPTVTTPTATSISTTSATLGGNITADGGDAITERGTIWKTSAGVTISDNKLAEGSTSTGTFSHSRTSLPAGTQIFYKAYATNGIGTTLSSEASFYTLSNEPSAHASSFSATANSQTQIDLAFSAASTITNAAGYLILQRSGAAPTGAPTDATSYSVGNTIGDGTVAAIITNTADVSKSITGLSAGTQYYFALFPYNGSASTINYKTDGTVPTANATTVAPLDATSEISGPASGSQPNPLLISSLATTDVAAVRVFDMDIYDYGTDGQPTKVTQLTIKAGANNTANWANTIQGVKLSTDAGSSFITIGTPTIAASSIIIPITSGNLNIPDADASTVSMYVYLKSSGLTDNQVLEFKVDATASSHGFTADATGSTFLATFASAPVSNQILVDVVATKLAFVQQPSNTLNNSIMSPAVTIEALDANNNRDLDKTGTVSITSSGTMTGSVSASLTSGFGTAGNIVHTVAGNTLSLTATLSGLTNAVSNNFNILQALAVGDILFLGYGTDDPDKFAFIAMNTIPEGTQITFTDNAYTGSALATNEGSTTWTSPIGGISKGTIVSIQGTTVTGGGSVGTNNMNFSTSGDQILAYQGSSSNPSFIAGVSSYNWINTGTPTSNNSYLPSNLTTNVNAVSFSSDEDNGYYNGPTTLANGALASFISNSANWIRSTSIQTFPAWSFTIGNESVINSNSTVQDLNIASNEILTVNANKQLTVSGTLTNNAGVSGLVLKSDATGTASLINSTAGVSATVERYLTGNVFHQLGLPISNTIAAGTSAGQTGDVFKYCTIDYYNESSNTYTGLTASDNVTPDKGYVVKYVYGASAPAYRTLSFTGTLNTGTVDIPITNAADGYNLIPNPYPSSIDWNAASGWTKNVHANNTLYIWNEAQNQYATYDGSAGTMGGDRYIAPGQAFFVKANTTGNLSMTNNVRMHNGTNYLKSSNTVADNLIKIKVSGDANAITDETVVYFTNNPASSGSEKWFTYEATAPSLYTVKSNQNYAINVLSDANTTVAVPLAFKPGVNGNYTLNATEIGNFSLCSGVTLEDLQTGNTQNILSNSIYSFSATTNDNVNRFVLHFATAVGVNEIGNSNGSIYAYDNSIYVNANEQIKQISVYNAMGQLVKTLNNVNGLQKINMNGNATGYYIVRVVSDKNVYSEKVLVK